MQSVVKSFHVRGETDRDGAIKVDINHHDANLSVGRWRMSLNNVIVTQLEEADADFPVCISATHTYSHVQQSNGQTFKLPACQMLSLLRYRNVNKCVVLTTERKPEWLEMQQPGNSFNLIFQNADTDQGLLLRVHVLLLLTRES